MDKRPLVANADDTGNRALVWGAYIVLTSADDATHETRTQSLSVEMGGARNAAYAWDAAVLIRTGFGFPGGRLSIGLCLEPRLTVGCGGGRQRVVKSGKIPLAEWTVRASDLEYGHSVDAHHRDSRRRHSQPPPHRRHTMVAEDHGAPLLFRPRDAEDQYTLAFHVGGGARMYVKYDACKYFDTNDGAMAGQFVASRIWLEPGDSDVLASAARLECHRVVCKVDTLVRRPPLGRADAGGRMSRHSSVYLGRPQSIETDEFGKTRTFRWTSDRLYRGRKSSFPGIPVMGEQDQDELEEMRSLGKMIRNQQRWEDPDVTSGGGGPSKIMDAIISARFLKQDRVYMPDNDEISNKRLVLPMDVDAGAVITFKFFNLRRDPASSHYFRSVELKVRCGEFASAHRGGGGGAEFEAGPPHDHHQGGEDVVPAWRQKLRRNSLKKRWAQSRRSGGNVVKPVARPIMELERSITEDIAATIRFSVASEGAAFEIISTALVVNNYADALQMRHPVHVQSM